MRASLSRLAAAAVVAAVSGPAATVAAPQDQFSPSLRCDGRLVARGEPVAALLAKCGEPVQRQAVCVPMLELGWIPTPYRPDGPGAALARQCVPMQEWVYDRGAGHFLGIVRLHKGAVESVRDGPRMR